jgi:hypothetical protein
MGTVKTAKYATIYYPGILFSESSTIKVRSFNPQTVLKKIKKEKSAFAFQFSERKEQGSGKERLTGSSKDVGPKYYIGEVLTAEQIVKLEGDYGILISNMKCNGWTHVVRCRAGNWQPLDPGDVVFDTKTLKQITPSPWDKKVARKA